MIVVWDVNRADLLATEFVRDLMADVVIRQFMKMKIERVNKAGASAAFSGIGSRKAKIPHAVK